MADKILIDAIAYALSREVVPSDEYYNRMSGIQRRQAVSIAGLGEIEQIKYVLDQVNKSLAEGKDFDEFKRSVKLKDIELPEYRLKTIYQTNVQQAYSHGRWLEQQRNKQDKPYLRYVAVNDSRTRPAHRALHGTVRHIDDPFWQTHTPPLAFNCFLPGTKVSGDITAAMLKSYKGVAVELTTKSGKTLSVTGNHPILTSRGWVRADNVTVGDSVLGDRQPVNGIDVNTVPGQVNNQETIPTVENLFNTFFTNAFAFGGTATLKFDSDITNGKIDINILDNGLAISLDSNLIKGVKEICFVNRLNRGALILTASDCASCSVLSVINAILSENTTDIAFTNIKALCKSILAKFGCSVELNNFRFEFVISSIGGSPSSGALPLNASRGLFDGLPLKRFSLGLSSESDALVSKVAINGRTTDAGLFGYLVNTHSREVFVDPVLDVRNFDFSGHVYDFQSENSLLSSGDIITHNCRCKVIAMTEEEAKEYGITSDDDLPDVKVADGFGHTPEQYNTKMTQLVSDRVAETMIEHYKQATTIGKIRNKVTSAIGQFLKKPITKLAALIVSAKKLLGIDE